MPKKKKPKPSSSRRGPSASPSSSSQSSGVNKQQPPGSPASPSPVQSDLADAVIGGSDTNLIQDLQLKLDATVHIDSDEIELSPEDTIKIPSSPLKAIAEVTAETPATQFALPPPVVNPESHSQSLVDSSPVNPIVGASSETPATKSALPAAAVNPETKQDGDTPQPSTGKVLENTPPTPAAKPSDEWSGLFKVKGKKLEKKGEPFTLPSGELCVKIPNSIIEKNKKAWDCFVIGQFYSDPPAQGLIHTIANGIWSKRFQDITVSKQEGHAFLFRIPNPETRRHVIAQRLWQFEGQTMFVAHWEPGFLPEKPALTSAPIWLELRNVPLQFFNEDGLERIAGLVGEPKFLHPATANKTILDVAKVLTVIDPRKPLPEAVNVQFDSGDIARVAVSSPWMPPVCSHCKEIGHTIKRCSAAPITCKGCKSTTHSFDVCPRSKGHSHKKDESKQKQKQRKSSASIHGRPSSQQVQPQDKGTSSAPLSSEQKGKAIEYSAPPTAKEIQADPGSKSFSKIASSVLAESSKAMGATSISEVDSDSSDVPSSDSDMEEGQYIPVRTKRRSRGGRGKGSKNN